MSHLIILPKSSDPEDIADSWFGDFIGRLSTYLSAQLLKAFSTQAALFLVDVDGYELLLILTVEYVFNFHQLFPLDMVTQAMVYFYCCLDGFGLFIFKVTFDKINENHFLAHDPSADTFAVNFGFSQILWGV